MKRLSKFFWIPVFALGLLFGALLPSARALPEKIYKALDLFSKVLYIVEKDYVETVDGQNLVYGAIKGMLGTLDPYTVFLTPDVYKELKVDTLGRFGGVGIEITLQNGVLTIVTPIEDTPAARAGIRAGDKIVKINGTLTKGMNLADAVRRMRGGKNSKLTLTLYREGVAKPFDVTLVREEIKIKSVKSEMLDKGVGFVRVASFQENTYEELKRALEQLSQQGMKSLILDLRNNPGGLLEQAIDMSDLFLKSGTIVSTRGRKGPIEVRSAKGDAVYPDLPFVVLINKGSASASEIVAGALQDNKRAKLLGTQSFGKGSVQTVIDLGEDTGVKLTVARYYTPSGKSIDGVGVTPDFIVEGEVPTPIELQEKKKVDVQRKAALDYLLTGKAPASKPESKPSKAEEAQDLPSDL
ncbi:S41 family peptidase [Deltaproteobacteria bacterium PRO3]|nr:S41 family peptidase [Deltaproteobacteria bacterium PRO3]